jgi:hypothetical protein
LVPPVGPARRCRCRPALLPTFQAVSPPDRRNQPAPPDGGTAVPRWCGRPGPSRHGPSEPTGPPGGAAAVPRWCGRSGPSRHEPSEPTGPPGGAAAVPRWRGRSGPSPHRTVGTNRRPHAWRLTEPSENRSVEGAEVAHHARGEGPAREAVATRGRATSNAPPGDHHPRPPGRVPASERPTRRWTRSRGRYSVAEPIAIPAAVRTAPRMLNTSSLVCASIRSRRSASRRSPCEAKRSSSISPR